MLSWVKGICSNNNSCVFQNALLNCTYADWSLPPQQSLKFLIQCFKGRHNDIIRSQKAFSKFKTKFQRHEDKNNTAFRLKNLLVLDRCTEQNCLLDIIAHYEYNRLFYDRNKVEPFLDSQSIQQFISTYYLYIKKKAQLYLKFPNQLFESKYRKSYINNANNVSRIFEFIDNAFQIQKQLNQANQYMKKVNKTPQLIQQVLTYMLKTYIFCYTIVAISLQTLLSKVKNMKNSQLSNLDRLIKYFSKQYTNVFLNFLESNKTVPAFKNFQYSELIRIDPSYIGIFDRYYRIKMQQSVSPKPVPSINGSNKSISTKEYSAEGKNLIDKEQIEENVQQLPDEVFEKLTLQLKFSYQPRLPFVQVVSSDAHIYATAFIQYKNFYSEDFIIEENLKNSKQLTNSINSQPPKLMKKSSSRIQKKKSLMQDLVNSRTLKRKSIRQSVPHKKFKEAIWITWLNIYAQ